jgi:NADPH:quinone reductase-like Zn-dependent oxidoreductase
VTLLAVCHTFCNLQLAELMASGKLKVTIHQVLPLVEAAQAHQISEEGHVRGKLVLQVAKE